MHLGLGSEVFFVKCFFYTAGFEHGGPGLTGGQGAGLGVLSGLIGAFVGVVVYTLTSFISMPLFQQPGAIFFHIQGDLPWDAGGFPGIILSVFFFLVLSAILCPLFRRHQRVYHHQPLGTFGQRLES